VNGYDRMSKYSNDAGFTVIETLEEIALEHQAAPAQISLAWMLANPVITSAIIGARTVEQLQETIKSVEISLSDEEITRLNSVAQAF